jgi:hypothetical protein
VPLLPRTLNVLPDELEALRSAMRDVQVSIGHYDQETAVFGADPDVLATRVRASVSFVQALNDLLRNEISDKSVYCEMTEPPEDARAEIIRAFTYVRNVMQHILHPVLPDPTATVGGFGLGFRTYAVWQEIPAAAHARLRPGTQRLKPLYDQHLNGRDVTDTLLDAAKFFALVCPHLVHSQPSGEWTGFPLLHQPGVPRRLHPEEPSEPEAALAWMAARRPGGDLRIVCGYLEDPTDGQIVFGLTFTKRCAFVPFFDTVEQVNADLALGFQYFEADVAAHTSERSEAFGFEGTRSVLCSDTPMDDWLGPPLVEATGHPEHATCLELDVWRTMRALEAAANPQAFITRRERRLNASVPR